MPRRHHGQKEPQTIEVMMTVEQEAAYFASQYGGHGQQPYPQLPQQQPEHVPQVVYQNRRRLLVPGIAIGVGATLLGSFITGNPGFEVSEPGTWMQGTVTEIKPIAFKECKSAMKTDLEGSRETDLVIYGKAVPGSGFDSTLVGKTDTLFCYQNPAETTVVVQGKNQTINIQADSIELHTRYIEDETTVVTGTPSLSAFGEAGGLILKGITLGKADILAEYNDEQKAKLASALRQEGVNTVETDCAEEAWPHTQQAITIAHKMEAEAQGIDPADITVNFIGKPKYVGEYDNSPTNISPVFRMTPNQKSFESQCTVNPDALKIESDDYKVAKRETDQSDIKDAFESVTQAVSTAMNQEPAA